MAGRLEECGGYGSALFDGGEEVEVLMLHAVPGEVAGHAPFHHLLPELGMVAIDRHCLPDGLNQGLASELRDMETGGVRGVVVVAVNSVFHPADWAHHRDSAEGHGVDLDQSARFEERGGQQDVGGGQQLMSRLFRIAGQVDETLVEGLRQFGQSLMDDAIHAAGGIAVDNEANPQLQEAAHMIDDALFVFEIIGE